MMERVIAPANKEVPHPSVVTKNSIPNRPYTMDGMPDRVSVVIRITGTTLLSRLAYSVR